jgi:hypothetical protein
VLAIAPSRSRTSFAEQSDVSSGQSTWQRGRHNQHAWTHALPKAQNLRDPRLLRSNASVGSQSLGKGGFPRFNGLTGEATFPHKILPDFLQYIGERPEITPRDEEIMKAK